MRNLKLKQALRTMGLNDIMDEGVMKVCDALRCNTPISEQEIATWIFKCHVAKETEKEKTILILLVFEKYAKKWNAKAVLNAIEDVRLQIAINSIKD